MQPTIVYDDAAATLGPLTHLRPSFEVRTGALRAIDRLARSDRFDVVCRVVPEHLVGLTDETDFSPVNDADAIDPRKSQPVLLVNGRFALSIDALEGLQIGERLVEQHSGDTIAAMVPARDAADFIRTRSLPANLHDRAHNERCLLHRPWDVIRFRDQAIRDDLNLCILHLGRGQPPDPRVIAIDCEHRLFLSHTATVHPGAILDCTHGPIVIDDHATVRPRAVIVGPAYIGPRSVIVEHAFIKANTAVGPFCKLGGEVGGCVFQGYANKVHEGHLGDAFVGEWANLGAGTTNSNLLNTYAEIVSRISPSHPNERTGLQYLGCIVGDHAKLAIMTRVMTGAVVGTGTMVASMKGVQKTVGDFRWITDDADRPYRFDKFLEVATTVMARRDKAPTPAYTARLQQLHAQAMRA